MYKRENKPSTTLYSYSKTYSSTKDEPTQDTSKGKPSKRFYYNISIEKTEEKIPIKNEELQKTDEKKNVKFEINKNIPNFKIKNIDDSLDSKPFSYRRYFNQSRNRQSYRGKKLGKSLHFDSVEKNDENSNDNIDIFTSSYRKEMRDRYNKNYYSTYNTDINDNETEKPLTSRYSRHFRENAENFETENDNFENNVNRNNWNKLFIEKSSIELISKKIGNNDVSQKKYGKYKGRYNENKDDEEGSKRFNLKNMRLVRNERFKVIGSENNFPGKLRNKYQENLNDLLEEEAFSITVIPKRRRKKQIELSFGNEDELKDFIKNNFNPDDIMKLFNIKQNDNNKNTELENIISKQKKDIIELRNDNNNLEKELKNKENEISKIINENKNLKDQIKQLKQNNIENNNSNRQEKMIYKKEIITRSNRPSAAEIKEASTVNKSNRPSNSQIETQNLSKTIFDVNKNITNIINQINTNDNANNLNEKKNIQTENYTKLYNTNNNYEIKNNTKEEKDKRIMQRINQRRVLSSQKDDKELKSSSMVNSRISNMAKELENVLRNRPNTNNNRTENVVLVNEDVINTIENKNVSQGAKRKKAKKAFNDDE